jgi:hypothetical protein
MFKDLDRAQKGAGKNESAITAPLQAAPIGVLQAGGPESQ